MIPAIFASSVLIVLIIAVRFLFYGKISRRMQYALWGLVLLRLLTPFFIFESPLSLLNAMASAGLNPSLSLRDSYSDNALIPPPVTTQDFEDGTQNTGVIPSPNALNNSNTHYAGLDGFLKKAGPVIWLSGSVLAGFWFAASNLRFYLRLRKDRTPLNSEGFRLPVYTTGSIASPCLYGLFRPAVYLTPKAAQIPSVTEHVLVHELCHYRHWDHLWSLLRGVCLAVWWWNPLVWAAASLSRTDCELACDEAAIKIVGDANRLSYARTLVDMIAVKRSAGGLLCTATTMNSGKKGIKERLNMIVRNPKALFPAMAAVVILACVLVTCAFTGPRTSDPDLSLLNVKNLANVSYQMDEVPISRTKDGQNTTVSGQALGLYLGQVDWAENKNQSLPQTAEAIRIKWNEDMELLFYEPGSHLAAVRVNLQFRYYTTSEGDYEDIVTLIEKKDLPVSPEDARLPYFNDMSMLDKAVSQAILYANKNSYSGGDFATEAHTVLKTKEDANTITVYIIALYMEFEYTGDTLKEGGGSYMPAAVTFKKQPSGFYIMTEYWTPEDGVNNGRSIRAKFPADIYSTLDTQKYIEELEKSCYEKARAFPVPDYDGAIRGLIEAIMASPQTSSNPQDYIDAHPQEFEQLMDYGFKTLRYCFTLFEAGNQTGLEGHIMAEACRGIVGAELEARTYENGQAWYEDFKANAISLQNKNGNEYLMKYYPGSLLLLQLIGRG